MTTIGERPATHPDGVAGGGPPSAPTSPAQGVEQPYAATLTEPGFPPRA
jgi:hypothetical protein